MTLTFVMLFTVYISKKLHYGIADIYIYIYFYIYSYILIYVFIYVFIMGASTVRQMNRMVNVMKNPLLAEVHCYCHVVLTYKFFSPLIFHVITVNTL